MNVKNYRGALLLAAVLVIIICVLVVIYTGKDENMSLEEINATYEYDYMLKEYNGQIGVYKADAKAPFRTLDVFVFNLPVVDQYELKEGIYIRDDEKLRIIIEDYTS